jgi:hypothetical protein
MSRFVFLVAAGCAIAACSPAGAQGLSGPHAAQARQACASVGFNTSEAPFAYCVMSLEQTAAEADQTAMTEEARQACIGTGQKPGTPAFANCVLDREGY